MSELVDVQVIYDIAQQLGCAVDDGEIHKAIEAHAKRIAELEAALALYTDSYTIDACMDGPKIGQVNRAKLLKAHTAAGEVFNGP